MISKNLRQEIVDALNLGFLSELKDSAVYCLVYSAAGRTALASIWDKPIEENVSVQYVKKRTVKVLKAYADIFGLENIEFENWADNIYEQYFACGYFYHLPYKLTSSIFSFYFNEENALALCRGIFPDEHLYMSGLGLYSFFEPSHGQQKSFTDLFQLQRVSFAELATSIQAKLNNSSTEAFCMDDAEFLNVFSPAENGYWIKSCDMKADFSMLRIKDNFHYYKIINGNFLLTKAESFEYRNAACTIKHRNKTLPAIRVEKIGQLIKMYVGYRLPQAEENFFMLYSWPAEFFPITSFKNYILRIMPIFIYKIFRPHLESLGYSFLEV